jgi:hypothetical protein
MRKQWQKDYRQDVNEVGGMVGWTLGRVFRLVVLPLVLFSFAVVGLSYGFGWCGEAAEVAQDTYGPKAAVRKYEWFKDKAHNIKNYEAQIVTAKRAVDQFKEEAGPRTGWSSEDKTEASRLAAVAHGLKNQRNSVAAEYNAAAAKATWSAFKTDDIPHHIEMLP